MSTPSHLPLHIRLMTLDDLPEVDAIEQVSFSAPWSIETFRREIQSNPRSFYWVARLHSGQNNPVKKEPVKKEPVKNEAGLPPILTYGGYWLLGEEAHIVILATHPDWRRRGLAEKLLIEMLDQMRGVGVHEVTLEVRAGNLAAQALYSKFGFEEVGRRKRYYRDNNEDALLLTLFNLHEDSVWKAITARTISPIPC